MYSYHITTVIVKPVEKLVLSTVKTYYYLERIEIHFRICYSFKLNTLFTHTHTKDFRRILDVVLLVSREGHSYTKRFCHHS